MQSGQEGNNQCRRRASQDGRVPTQITRNDSPLQVESIT